MSRSSGRTVTKRYPPPWKYQQQAPLWPWHGTRFPFGRRISHPPELWEPKICAGLFWERWPQYRSLSEYHRPGSPHPLSVCTSTAGRTRRSPMFIGQITTGTIVTTTIAIGTAIITAGTTTIEFAPVSRPDIRLPDFWITGHPHVDPERDRLRPNCQKA
jgi:hypothetical protein